MTRETTKMLANLVFDISRLRKSMSMEVLPVFKVIYSISRTRHDPPPLVKGSIQEVDRNWQYPYPVPVVITNGVD